MIADPEDLEPSIPPIWNHIASMTYQSILAQINIAAALNVLLGGVVNPKASDAVRRALAGSQKHCHMASREFMKFIKEMQEDQEEGEG